VSRHDADAALSRLFSLCDGPPPPHLFGDLASHLLGTYGLLTAWRARTAVARAGLFHAAYGTDGFPHALLPLNRRRDVASLIGGPAERLVHLYAACDRQMFHDSLIAGGPPRFRDRFADAERDLTGSDLAGLCELTAANELELVGQGPAHWARYGPVLAPLFRATTFRALVSQPARTALDLLPVA
jgi:hypothetical protein